MDFSGNVENKLKQLLNKLVQIKAVKSFKLVIKWGKKVDLVKVDLSALNHCLDECLGKIVLKPRRAEIRNVISELVKKKNDLDFLSEISETADPLTENDAIFYCYECNVEFENDDDYAVHANLLHGSGTCEKPNQARANKGFDYFPNKIGRDTNSESSNAQVLPGSLKPAEKASKQYLCERCGMKFFKELAWKNHPCIARNQKMTFKCRKCALSFSDDYLLKSHVKSHEAGESQRERTCLKSLDSLDMCEEQSERSSLRKLKDTSDPNSVEQEPESSHPRSAEFKCDRCSRSFESKRGLRTHFSHEHRELACRKEGCAWYGLKFKSRKEFQNHVKSECKLLPDGKFCCFYSDCGQVFKLSKYLRKHIRLNHLPQKTTFNCHLCPKTFFEKTKLNRHVDGHHEEKFRCDLCSKTFTRGDVLKRHALLVHQKEKKFQCKVCRKMFSLKYNRDCHEENVHVNNKSIQLNCEICGKMLRNKSTLRIHMKIHHPEKNFSCSLCGKKFIRQIHYQTHMKNQHFGISPFQNLLDSFAADGDVI